MSVTEVRKDTTKLTMTMVSEWNAPVEKVWQLWADPRKLERWWGPPTYPATVVEHDLRPGGRVAYFMTGPDGDRHAGWWRVISVDERKRLELQDGFADADGIPNDSMPTTMFTVTFDELAEGRTAMTIESRFPSGEAMAQLTAMGMDEGMRAAMSQIDAILVD
jgi:uncharacterized protein YndB with AHSA1/START domain